MVLRTDVRLFIILAVSLAAIVALALVPRVPQDPGYHQFADQRVLWGIPYCLNVLSNIPFVVLGAYGLFYLLRRHFFALNANHDTKILNIAYMAFFTGVLLTGFGSAHYHGNPANESLVWDRVPMTIIFMSFLTGIIGERINTKSGLALLLPLVVLGIASVIYWHITERHGNGDLRPYILVQYFPLVLIPLILLLYPSNYPGTGDIIGVFAFYMLAKSGEVMDEEIFSIGNVVSGHTIKHLFAAVAVFWVFRMIRKKDRLSHKTHEII